MKFSLFVIIFGVIGYLSPPAFVWAKAYIIPLLIVIMTSMALTLTLVDFKRVFTNPKPIVLGVGLQFIVMPLLALGIGRVFQLPEEYILGMVLVGSVAGGTASNVMCFLAGGRVAPCPSQ